MSMPDAMLILMAMSLARAADRLNPTATNTASSRAKTFLIDHDMTG
jgi:hypothetical protein